MNSFTKQKNNSQTQKKKHKKQLMVTKGKWVGGINQEFGINRYKLLYIKQISNKDLLYNTGNYIQYIVITYNGK